MDREGQEADGHQRQEVDPHHAVVGVPQTAEDAVVGEPDPADREEARREAEVRRPFVEDALPEVVERRRRHADVEDEQRDRDRETPSLNASVRPVSQ